MHVEETAHRVLLDYSHIYAIAAMTVTMMNGGDIIVNRKIRDNLGSTLENKLGTKEQS